MKSWDDVMRHINESDDGSTIVVADGPDAFDMMLNRLTLRPGVEVQPKRRTIVLPGVRRACLLRSDRLNDMRGLRPAVVFVSSKARAAGGEDLEHRLVAMTRDPGQIFTFEE